MRPYAAPLGALASSAPLTVEHGLDTEDIVWSIRELSGVSSGLFIFADVKTAGPNAVTVESETPYPAGALRIVIIGVDAEAQP